MAKKIRPITAWADVGSHGGIFYFHSGLVADRYPGLLQIYKDKLTPDLVEVRITRVNRKRDSAAIPAKGAK